MKKHNACIARSGIQYYLLSELPNLNLKEIPREYRDMKVFAVYRPSFVLEDAKEKFIGKPIRVEHQWIYSENDKDILGHIGNEVKIKHQKGEVALYSPLEIDSDEKLPSFKELSPGYEAVNKWQPGVTPSGEEYQIVCTEITNVNHLAIVETARGGKDMKILDGGKKMAVHSGLLYFVKKKLSGVNDGNDANSFGSIIDKLTANIKNVSDEELSGMTESLIKCVKDLPDSDEKEKVIRYIADIPLLKEEDEKVVDEALSCIKESFNSLDSDAVSETMEKKDMENPKKETEEKKDGLDAKSEVPSATASVSPVQTPTEKKEPAGEPKPEEKKETDGDAISKLVDAIDSMNKKLDAILGGKKEEPKKEPKEEPKKEEPKEEPKKEEPKADGCGEGGKAPEETPKVEDSAPSSLPQYTQSLGSIEKGYSLDDVFARLKGKGGK